MNFGFVVREKLACRLLQQKSGTFALFCWLSQHQMSQYAKIRDGIQLAVQEAASTGTSRLDEISYFLAFLKRLANMEQSSGLRTS